MNNFKLLTKGSKKKIKILAVAIMMVTVSVVGVAANIGVIKSKANEIDSIENQYETIETPIIQDVDVRDENNYIENEHVDDSKLQEAYSSMDSGIFNKYRVLNEEQISDLEQQVASRYNEGDILSEEDRNFILYLECEYDKKDIAQEGVIQKAWTTRKYNIKNSKTSNGVTASYSGNFETWAGSQHSKYGVNVKVNLSKNVKSAKFTVSHTAYGVLGWSGKIPTIGVVYNGSISSGSYTKSFSYNQMKTYAAIWPVRSSVWGSLKVKTSSGEFTMNTKTYKSWE